MNDIVLIKLISGEEIIGTVEHDATDTVTLANTVSVAYHPTGDGKMSAGFAPHMPYADGSVILFKTAIALRASLKEEMLHEYKRIFGGLIVPRQGILT